MQKGLERARPARSLTRGQQLGPMDLEEGMEPGSMEEGGGEWYHGRVIKQLLQATVDLTVPMGGCQRHSLFGEHNPQVCHI